MSDNANTLDNVRVNLSRTTDNPIAAITQVHATSYSLTNQSNYLQITNVSVSGTVATISIAHYGANNGHRNFLSNVTINVYG